MKLSEIKRILAARDIQLTKSLGQNFLHDGNQLQRIVAAARLASTDRILEVGPGLGPLTDLLLQHTSHVLAIEKDARLVAVLKQRFADAIASAAPAAVTPQAHAPGRGALELLHADALDFLKQRPRDWAEWKLVANLPYSVASPILVELSQANRGPAMMVATLQIEVAKRLMSPADTRDYGVLTVLIQAVYEPTSWFKIPAGSFFPEPDVESACVCLTRRAQPLVQPGPQQATFVRVVKRGFSQRRKMMLKLLKQDWPAERLLAAFDALTVSTTARAENLTPKQFAALTNLLSPAAT